MRKSLLLTLEFPPQKGGTQTYYFNICQNLPSDKIVVLGKREKGKGKSGSNFAFKIYRKNLLVGFIWPHWLPMIWYLWRIIKKEKIELVQVGQVLPCGAVALIIKKILNIPYIVYTHGLDILAPQNNSRKLKLMKKILNEAESVVSNSEFVKNEVVKLGVDVSKVSVVCPCVVGKTNRTPHPPLSGGLSKLPTNSVSPSWLVDCTSPPDKGGWGVLAEDYRNIFNKKILLTVCRLVDRKGVDNVIRSLNGISEQMDDWVYVIVGDGPERLRLEKLVDELFSNKKNIKIIFTGRVSDEELSAWYDVCDIFILTPKQSKFDVEGFGIVYLEANLHGKPVIGSKMSGIVEAIKDGVSGFLVEPDDLEKISIAILKLINDESLRKKIGEQGRLRALENFNIEKQMEKIISVLR